MERRQQIICQNTPYQQQIREAAEMLHEAEYMLVGAGAGLSTAGFYPYPDEESIFCTQGDYFHIQCRHGCHARTYHAVKLFQQMDQAVVPESFGAKAVGINADMAESIRDMAKELKSFAH